MNIQYIIQGYSKKRKTWTDLEYYSDIETPLENLRNADRFWKNFDDYRIVLLITSY